MKGFGSVSVGFLPNGTTCTHTTIIEAIKPLVYQKSIWSFGGTQVMEHSPDSSANQWWYLLEGLSLQPVFTWPIIMNCSHNFMFHISTYFINLIIQTDNHIRDQYIMCMINWVTLSPSLRLSSSELKTEIYRLDLNEGLVMETGDIFSSWNYILLVPWPCNYTMIEGVHSLIL